MYDSTDRSPAKSPLERFSRWMQLKIYQFEVTYSVYIFTPAEKFFLYTLLFLLFSLCTIAIVVYLPQHIAFILGRAWFYVHGDSVDVVELTKEAVHTLAAGALGGGASATSASVVKEL